MTAGTSPGADRSDDLEAVLETAQQRGFLGPGALGPQVDHARGFAAAVGAPPVSFLDLGSGGGLPGLVVARSWPASRGVLLDASTRRTELLVEACDRLGLSPRVSVVCARAEVAGRAVELRGRFEVVLARSFGPPAVTAECGAPFLAEGGALVVSEPPHGAGTRWPEGPLKGLGLEVERIEPGPPGFVVLRQVFPLEERWPRRTGVPGKRPLWR